MYMAKPGSLESATNYPPFEAKNASHPDGHAPYVPKDKRLDQWLMQKKLTPEVRRGRRFRFSGGLPKPDRHSRV